MLPVVAAPLMAAHSESSVQSEGAERQSGGLRPRARTACGLNCGWPSQGISLGASTGIYLRPQSCPNSQSAQEPPLLQPSMCGHLRARGGPSTTHHRARHGPCPDANPASAVPMPTRAVRRPGRPPPTRSSTRSSHLAPPRPHAGPLRGMLLYRSHPVSVVQLPVPFPVAVRRKEARTGTSSG